METIADARVRVQNCFDSMLDLAADDGVTTVEALEEVVWPQLLETGRAVLRLFLTLRANRPRAAARRQLHRRPVLPQLTSAPVASSSLLPVAHRVACSPDKRPTCSYRTLTLPG